MLDSAHFIVKHSGVTSLLCSEETLHVVRPERVHILLLLHSLTFDCARQVRAMVVDGPQQLRLIVSADPIPVAVLASWNADVKCRDVHLMSYDELLSRGRKSGSGMQQRLGGKPTDVACIMCGKRLALVRCGRVFGCVAIYSPPRQVHIRHDWSATRRSLDASKFCGVCLCRLVAHTSDVSARLSNCLIAVSFSHRRYTGRVTA